MYSAENVPAAAYTGISSFITSSSSLPLHFPAQLATLDAAPQNPSTPQNLASLAASLITPSTRWPAPMLHSESLPHSQLDTVRSPTVNSPTTAVDLAPAVLRRISFGQTGHETTVGQGVPVQAIVATSPVCLSASGGKEANATQAAPQQQPSARSESVRAHRKRKATLQFSEASWQTEATAGMQHDQGEASGWAVKRRKHGIREVNEQSEVSDAAPSSARRVLRAVTSVRGSHHGSRAQDKSESQQGTRQRGSDQQSVVVLQTTIEQLQHELKVRVALSLQAHRKCHRLAAAGHIAKHNCTGTAEYLSAEFGDDAL